MRSFPWSVPCRSYYMIYTPRLRKNCIRVGSRQTRDEDLKAAAGNHRRSGGGLISHVVQFYTDTNSRECSDRCSGLEDEKPVGVPISCSESWVIFYGVLKADDGGESMFHLIWYILIGLISGVIAKSVMHTHMTIFWTIVLGIIGSIIGGAVTNLLFRSRNDRYHPAGLIFSTLGAILVLFICYKLNIHFPQVVIPR